MSFPGFALSLFQIWQAARAERASKDQTDVDDAITDYLERLRRQDHEQSLKEFKRSRHATRAVRELIFQLMLQTDADAETFLKQLAGSEDRLGSKLDDLMREMKARGSLFANAPAPVDDRIVQFEKTYLARVRSDYDRLRLIGVNELPNLTMKTSIAFVSLRIRREPEQGEDLTNRAEDVLQRVSRLTVRGVAGSGKTTLLRWIALQCAETEREGNLWRGGIPFFIPLRGLVNLDAEKGRPDIGRFVEYTIPKEKFPRQAPDGWIDQVLRDKRGIVLLDGVDELPPGLRPGFWEWLSWFHETYPGNRVYVSSRPFEEAGPKGPRLGNPPRSLKSCDPEGVVHTRRLAPLWNPPRAFKSCDLDELDADAVRELIEKWHDAVGSELPEGSARDELTEERGRLPGRLKEPRNRQVRALCRNPLLCAMVCALNWHVRGKLPQERIKLYALCCDLLIDAREKAGEIRADEGPARFLTLKDKKRVLQHLA